MVFRRVDGGSCFIFFFFPCQHRKLLDSFNLTPRLPKKRDCFSTVWTLTRTKAELDLTFGPELHQDSSASWFNSVALTVLRKFISAYNREQAPTKTYMTAPCVVSIENEASLFHKNSHLVHNVISCTWKTHFSEVIFVLEGL